MYFYADPRRPAGEQSNANIIILIYYIFIQTYPIIEVYHCLMRALTPPTMCEQLLVHRLLFTKHIKLTFK